LTAPVLRAGSTTGLLVALLFAGTNIAIPHKRL